MKNLSLALNILLLLAVAYLYIDRFSGEKSGDTTAQTGESAELQIVYLNADSILYKYDYFRKRSEELLQREQDEDRKLKERGKAIEREMQALQKRYESGTMTPKQQEEEYLRIQRQQQNLMADQERIARELTDAGQRLNDELQKALKENLDSLKKNKGYTYVLSYGIGSPVLSAVDSLDITGEVLRLLNKE